METPTITSAEAGKEATAGFAETTTMKAAVIEKPGKIALKNVPLPKAGPGEIVFKVEGCGVCASSIPVYEGRDWFTYPVKAGNPGHESWGKVVEVGEGVSNFKIGDRIAAIAYHGFANFDKAHQDFAIKLPEEISHMDFPGEPLGCAMNIFRRSDIKEGHTVAIIGIGFLGALLVQLAKSRGAKVIAISRRDFSLETAKKCGADETIALDDHWKVIEKVREITGEKFCDRVIEATGKEWPLNLAGEICRERGRLIVAGFHQDGMRQVNVQLWNWRGLDVINAHERDPRAYIKGMMEAVDAVMAGRMDPSALYTHTFRLDNIHDAFAHLVNRPHGYMKAIVKS